MSVWRKSDCRLERCKRCLRSLIWMKAGLKRIRAEPIPRLKRNLLFAIFFAMKFQRVFALLLFGVLTLAGCKREAPPRTPPDVFHIDPMRGHLLHAQDRLPTMKL